VRHSLLLVILSLAALAGAPTSALAQAQAEADAGATTDPEAEADTLTEAAREATAAGQVEEAVRLLREALERAPGAARAFNLSLVLRDAGAIVEAVETIDALLAGRWGALPDDRRLRAEEIRAELATRIATLIIRVSGAERVSLQLDDRAIADALEGTALRLQVDPGRHVVVARADGHDALRREVDAAAGRSVTLALALEPVQSPDPILPPPNPHPAPRDEGSGVSPWIFVAIGAALLIGGGIALGVALSSGGDSQAPETFVGRAETLRFGE
jgi:tetratricopeptide (TPR) repeat protein